MFRFIKRKPIIACIALLSVFACSQKEAEQLPITQFNIVPRTLTQFKTLIPDHPGTFGVPASIDFDQEGNLYVLDTADAKILKMNQQYELAATFGGRGNGPGELQVNPTWGSRSRLAVGGKLLAVADNRSGQISVFTLDGEFLKRFRSPGHVNSLAMSHDDRILINTATTDSLVTEYSSDGLILSEYGQHLIPFDNQLDNRRFYQWTVMRLTLLPNDLVIAVSDRWPLIRIFQHGSFLREVPIHLEDLFLVCTKEESIGINMLVDGYDSRSISDVATLAERGESPIGLFIGSPMVVAKNGNDVWVSYGHRMIAIMENGHIGQTLLSKEERITGDDFAIHGSRFVVANPWDALLTIGEIPKG